MLEPPRITPGIHANKQFEEWIDSAITGNHDVLKVAAIIASVTQRGGTADYEISPELYGAEGWYWPWNRAGFLCFEWERPSDAATLFTCAYLAALRFQAAGKYRIHKGMPLCNISYAWLRAEQGEKAILPALLGMVEDAATTGNATESANFANLMATQFPEGVARNLHRFFLLFTRQRGIVALYPEPVLDCAYRAFAIFSSSLISNLTELSNTFRPEDVEGSLEKLQRIWSDLQTSINATLDRSKMKHGEVGVVNAHAHAPVLAGATSPAQ